jgi:hypothetical protein
VGSKRTAKQTKDEHVHHRNTGFGEERRDRDRDRGEERRERELYLRESHVGRERRDGHGAVGNFTTVHKGFTFLHPPNTFLRVREFESSRVRERESDDEQGGEDEPERKVKAKKQNKTKTTTTRDDGCTAPQVFNKPQKRTCTDLRVRRTLPGSDCTAPSGGWTRSRSGSSTAEDLRPAQ